MNVDDVRTAFRLASRVATSSLCDEGLARCVVDIRVMDDAQACADVPEDSPRLSRRGVRCLRCT